MDEPRPAPIREHRSSSDDIQIINEVISPPKPKTAERRRLFPNLVATDTPIAVIDLEDDLPPPPISQRASVAREVLLEQERELERASQARRGSSIRTSLSSSTASDNDSEYLPRRRELDAADFEDMDMERDLDDNLSMIANSRPPSLMDLDDEVDPREEIPDELRDELNIRVNVPVDYMYPVRENEDDDVIVINEVERRRPTASNHVEIDSDDSRDSDDEFYEQYGDRDIEYGNESEEIEDDDDPERTRQQKLKKKKLAALRSPGKIRMETQHDLKIVDYDPRPVLFRREPTPPPEGKTKAKGKRVTEGIYKYPIRQYHKAFDDTPLEDMPVVSLSECIEEYLTAGKPFLPHSQKLADEMVCAAVEHNDHVKMLHFGQEMKKYSTNQKQRKFQLAWWDMEIKENRNKKGRFGKAPAPVCLINEDMFLFEQHFLGKRGERSSQLQKIMSRYKDRINKRRTTNDAIRDSSFFVREFFLTKMNISLRITRSAELPECYVPPAMHCGYYPVSVSTDEEKKHYLNSRYREAQVEYFNITYRNIDPPKGYSIGYILDNELLEFHENGRHIHGFFMVWIEDEIQPGFKARRRYLVDIFCLLRFPLYQKWENWETMLKVNFDKVSTYDLHLAEVIRCNRPVFDTLAQTQGLLQPFSGAEMALTYTEPRLIIQSTSFKHSTRHANLTYLSAFTMIIGGVKVLHTIRRLAEKAQVLAMLANNVDHCIVDKNGESYTTNADVPVRGFRIWNRFKDNVIEVMDRKRPTGPIQVRKIVTVPKKAKPPPPKPAVKNMRSFQRALSRKQLMPVREKLYGFRHPAIQRRKEPTGPPKKGRKPKNVATEQLKKHPFDDKMQASDIESCFDGYDSDREMMEYAEEGEHFLKRSTSSDSIFLDYTYKEMLYDRVSAIHYQKIPRELESTRKHKWRKMRRIRKSRALHAKRNADNRQFLSRLKDCVSNHLPITDKHASETKIAMRNPSKFEVFNIPRVFKKSETNMVNDVVTCLAHIVNAIEAKEIASGRGMNRLTLFRQDSITERRKNLSTLKENPNAELPPPEFCAAEMMSGTPVHSRITLNNEIERIKDSIPKNAADARQKIALREAAKKERYEKMLETFAALELQRINAQLAEHERLKEREKAINKKKNDKKAEKKRMLKMGLDPNAISQKQAEEQRRLQEEQQRKKEEERLAKERLELEKQARLEREQALLHAQRIKLLEERLRQEQQAREKAKKEEAERAAKAKEAERLRREKEKKEQENREDYEKIHREKEEIEKALELSRKSTEAFRLKEEARKKREAEEAEAARKAEEAKRAEAAKKAQEAKQAEAKRAEEAKKAEAARQAEEAKRVAEAKKAEQARKAEEKKAEEARKIAQRQKLARLLAEKKQASVLPDEEDVYLENVIVDLTNPKFRRARHHFQNTNIRLLMKNQNTQWSKEFFAGCGMRSDFVIDTLYRMVETPYVAPSDTFQSLIFTNLTKCFNYAVIGPQQREWQFEYSEHLLKFDYKNRVLSQSDLDLSYNLAGNRSARQSLMRTHAGLLSTPLRHSTGDYITPERFALKYSSQIAYEKEVNATLNVRLHRNPNQSASIVIPRPDHASVQKTIRMGPLATSTPKPDAFKTPQMIRPAKTVSGKRLFDVVTKSTLTVQTPQTSLTPQASPRTQPSPALPTPRTLFKTPEPPKSVLTNTNTESSASEKLASEVVLNLTPIWKLVTSFDRENMPLRERIGVLEKLDELLKSSKVSEYRKMCWSFGIIPVLCKFATGMLADSSSICCRRTLNPVITKDTPGAMMVIEKLLETSQIMAEACNDDKTKFRKTLRENGFEFTKIAATRVINAMGNLILGLETRKLFHEGSDSKHIFCEVTKEIYDLLVETLKEKGTLTENEIYVMSKDSELTSNAVLEKQGWDSYVRKAEEDDSERVYRVRSLHLWYTSLNTYGDCMTESVKKLFSRMELQKVGVQWREMERAQESSEREINLDETDLKSMWADLSTIQEDTVDSQSIEEQKQLKKERKLKRKLEAENEARLPSKLPHFEINFEDVAWKTIERTFDDLSGGEWDTVPVFKNYRRGHKRSDARFHIIIRSTDSSGKKKLIPMIMDNKNATRKESETKALTMFKNQIFKEKHFNEMRWMVGSKSAFEFFTDLDQYKNNFDAFKQSVSEEGLVEFNFKVYKHHWIMGNTLPQRCCPDSHEDTTFKACGGCTNGDVVLVPDCLCEHYDQSHDGGACHVSATPAAGPLELTMLVGRFVCKHGPNSLLHLETGSVAEQTFSRSGAEYNEYSAQLRVVSTKGMFKELNDTLNTTSHPEVELASSDEQATDKSSAGESDTELDDAQSTVTGTTQSSLYAEPPARTVPDASLTQLLTSRPRKRKTALEDSEDFPSQQESGITLFEEQPSVSTRVHANQKNQTQRKWRKPVMPPRARSLDREQNGKSHEFKGRKRCSSVCSFAYLEKYAAEKIDYLAREYNKENNHITFAEGTKQISPEQIRELYELPSLMKGVNGFQEKMNQSEMLFMRLITSGKPENLSVGAAKDLDREAVEKSLKLMPLMGYKGACISSDKFPAYEQNKLVRGESVSLVMDQYYIFEQYIKDKLFEASVMVRGVAMMKSRDDQAYRNLYDGYEVVMKLNLGLFEHMMYLISKHIFNPYAIYFAETNQSVDHIKKTLRSVRENLDFVKNAMFNMEPLERQRSEIRQLGDKLDRKMIHNIGAAIAKSNITRIRAPSTVSLPSSFNRWLNSNMDFNETVDMITFSLRDTLPERIERLRLQEAAEEIGFRYEFFKGRWLKIGATSAMSDFYEIIFNQSRNFLSSFTSRGKLKREDIDPHMRAYYEHKTFRTMLQLIKRKTFLTAQDINSAPAAMNALMCSAIISAPKLRFDIGQDARMIDNLYEKLIRIRTDEVYIEPSNIGSIFSCFDNSLYYSVVRERKLEVHRDYLIPNLSCIRENEDSIDVVCQTCSITLIVNKSTGMLSIVFKTLDLVGKDDRLAIETLDRTLMYDTNNRYHMDWAKILQIYISSSYQVLRRILTDFNNKRSRQFAKKFGITGNERNEDKQMALKDPRMYELAPTRDDPVSVPVKNDARARRSAPPEAEGPAKRIRRNY